MADPHRLRRLPSAYSDTNVYSHFGRPERVENTKLCGLPGRVENTKLCGLPGRGNCSAMRFPTQRLFSLCHKTLLCPECMRLYREDPIGYQLADHRHSVANLKSVVVHLKHFQSMLDEARSSLASLEADPIAYLAVQCEPWGRGRPLGDPPDIGRELLAALGPWLGALTPPLHRLEYELHPLLGHTLRWCCERGPYVDCARLVLGHGEFKFVASCGPVVEGLPVADPGSMAQLEVAVRAYFESPHRMCRC